MKHLLYVYISNDDILLFSAGKRFLANCHHFRDFVIMTIRARISLRQNIQRLLFSVHFIKYLQYLQFMKRYSPTDDFIRRSITNTRTLFSLSNIYRYHNENRQNSNYHQLEQSIIYYLHRRKINITKERTKILLHRRTCTQRNVNVHHTSLNKYERDAISCVKLHREYSDRYRSGL